MSAFNHSTLPCSTASQLLADAICAIGLPPLITNARQGGALEKVLDKAPDWPLLGGAWPCCGACGANQCKSSLYRGEQPTPRHVARICRRPRFPHTVRRCDGATWPRSALPVRVLVAAVGAVSVFLVNADKHFVAASPQTLHSLLGNLLLARRVCSTTNRMSGRCTEVCSIWRTSDGGLLDGRMRKCHCPTPANTASMKTTASLLRPMLVALV